MISGIGSNRIYSRNRGRKVDPIRNDHEYNHPENETIIIDVEYEDLSSSEIIEEAEVLTDSTQESLSTYDCKGKIKSITRKRHNLEKIV